MEEHTSGAWLPLQEAANRLGISVDSARKKAQRGTVVARRVPRAQGHTWEIYLDTIQVDSQLDGIQVESSSVQVGAGWDPGALTTAVLELTRENSRLAQENLQLAGRLGFIEAQLQQRDERIARLEAPKTEGVLSDSDKTQRAPWWAFWRRPPSEPSPA